MTEPVFYTPLGSEALLCARQELSRQGIAFTEKPTSHVTHLLLGAPAFQEGTILKGNIPIDSILCNLAQNITVLGGNLRSPALFGYKAIDLLQDPYYLAQNANITAHCALRLALWHLPVTLDGCPILIIGWGRIGKCLAQLLRSIGAAVTVAVRKESDLALLRALGYNEIDIAAMQESLSQYRVIFNTVPAPVLSEAALATSRPDCLKIDLSSVKGMDAQDVIFARGLPGKDAPESSGHLIAKTVLRLIS